MPTNDTRKKLKKGGTEYVLGFDAYIKSGRTALTLVDERGFVKQTLTSEPNAELANEELLIENKEDVDLLVQAGVVQDLKKKADDSTGKKCHKVKLIAEIPLDIPSTRQGSGARLT